MTKETEIEPFPGKCLKRELEGAAREGAGTQQEVRPSQAGSRSLLIINYLEEWREGIQIDRKSHHLAFSAGDERVGVGK